MTGRAWTLGRIRGVELRIEPSWVLIALLVTWSFWARFGGAGTPSGAGGRNPGAAAAMALLAAALFFGSVLAHELAHALEAQHRGVTVRSITLFLFGGVTESKFDVRHPRDELALTVAGPFTSFVAAAVGGLVATGLRQPAVASATGALGSAVADVFALVGLLNVGLGLFNLLPGAPLDGGRVVRALVWWVTGDRRRAVRVAARLGQALGLALIATALLQLVAMSGGAGVGGFWLALIGWFLFQAAGRELLQDRIEAAIGAERVATLLGPPPEPVPPDLPAGEAIDHRLAWRPDAFVLVADPAGTADPAGAGSRATRAGVLALDRLAHLTAAERAAPVIHLAAPVDSFPAVDVTADARDLLSRLAASAVVVVRDGDTPVAVVSADRLEPVLRRRLQGVR